MNWKTENNITEKNIYDFEMELEHFKKSMNEWIMFLNQQNKEARERMMSLERRLAKLELDTQLRF